MHFRSPKPAIMERRYIFECVPLKTVNVFSFAQMSQRTAGHQAEDVKAAIYISFRLRVIIIMILKYIVFYEGYNFVVLSLHCAPFTRGHNNIFCSKFSGLIEELAD